MKVEDITEPRKLVIASFSLIQSLRLPFWGKRLTNCGSLPYWDK